MDMVKLKQKYEQAQKLQRACHLIKIKASQNKHSDVTRLLEMTRPQRLDASVLIHMVDCQYPIEHLMDRFTPTDCNFALLKAVEKGRTQTVVFLLEFVADTINVAPLTSLAIQNDDAATLKVLSTHISQEEKLRLLRRSCFKTSTDNIPSKKSLSPCEIAEVLLEDTPTSELKNIIEQADNTPTLQAACHHVYALRQQQILEKAVSGAQPTRALTRKI